MPPLKTLEYIVNEIVRRYGDLPPRFIQNVRRNVRRNFKVSIASAEIERLIPLYQAMYEVAAAEIQRSLGGTPTPSLEEGNRLATEFGASLASRYPDQPPSVLRMVAGWALYYEIYR